MGESVCVLLFGPSSPYPNDMWVAVTGTRSDKDQEAALLTAPDALLALTSQCTMWVPLESLSQPPCPCIPNHTTLGEPPSRFVKSTNELYAGKSENH